MGELQLFWGGFLKVRHLPHFWLLSLILLFPTLPAFIIIHHFRRGEYNLLFLPFILVVGIGGGGGGGGVGSWLVRGWLVLSMGRFPWISQDFLTQKQVL